MHEPSSPSSKAIDDAAVAEAVRELDSLDSTPVHGHPAVIDSVHRALQDRLSEPDAR